MANSDSQQMNEAVMAGAALLERGVTDRERWFRAMVYQFGDQISPQLPSLWTLAQEELNRRRTAEPPEFTTDSQPLKPPSIIMLKESTYRFLLIGLLSASLTVQTVIMFRMPASAPTVGELRNSAMRHEGRRVADRMPMVRVSGTVGVNVENTPLDVNVENTPLEMQILR